MLNAYETCTVDNHWYIVLTICANSMAAKAGESQPLLLTTSTHAWIKRMAWKEGKTQFSQNRKSTSLYVLGVMILNLTLARIFSVSDCSSAESWRRERWAWSRRFAFTWGSLNFWLAILWGTREDNWGKSTINWTLVIALNQEVWWKYFHEYIC